MWMTGRESSVFHSKTCAEHYRRFSLLCLIKTKILDILPLFFSSFNARRFGISVSLIRYNGGKVPSQLGPLEGASPDYWPQMMDSVQNIRRVCYTPLAGTFTLVLPSVKGSAQYFIRIQCTCSTKLSMDHYTESSPWSEKDLTERTLMMEAMCSSETSVVFHRTTQRILQKIELFICNSCSILKVSYHVLLPYKTVGRFVLLCPDLQIFGE
jgi:hypothetical protein